MGKDSAIQWTDHTYNPWVGCRKVSAGCDNCYMYRDQRRYGHDPEVVHRTSPATFNAPLTWKAPGLVFTCSWSDWFIVEADAWRQEAWEIVRKTPHLTYQILTKRPSRAVARPSGQDWPRNAWIGTSIENQAAVDARRVESIMKIPAPIRFLSVEPLLGPVDLPLADIHWVIVGGESGPGARPMDIAWVRDIQSQCEVMGVPIFVKQMGSVWAAQHGGNSHGADTALWPEDLRVREFPKLEGTRKEK